MANTFPTELIPTLHQAIDIVSRERVGFIGAVAKNSAAERAALNEPILIPITPPATAADNTPAMTPPDTGDQTIGSTTMLITNSKHVPVRWTGEETKGLKNSASYEALKRQRFAQGFRTLCNMIESDLAALYPFASRAYGTAGQTPFGTKDDLTDVAGMWQVLADNGAPESDLQLVLSTAAAANIMGKQASLFKVNEAGTADLLRRGSIGELEGFGVHKSAQVKAVTKGTGTGYLVNNVSNYAIGDTAITTDTGTGTILAGDVVTAAGDASKYVVGTALTSNVVTLNKPGLRAALLNDVALTVGGSYRANMAFHRDAIQLITRLPAQPEEGDLATGSTLVEDPISGLVFEVALYKGFGQNVFHVRIAWGVKAIKPEHIALLLG